MKRHLCSKCIVTTPKGDKIPAWIEVNDHGMDLRFYHRPSQERILETDVQSWDLPKDIRLKNSETQLVEK